MKKITIIASVLSVALASSCRTENIEMPVNENPALVEMSFDTCLPGTKTTLVDGTKINWSTGDKISIFSLPAAEGAYEGAKYTEYNYSVFTPDAAGSSTKISGKIVPNEWDEYYAVYPSTAGSSDANAAWQERSDFMQINVSSQKETGRTLRHVIPEKQSGTGEENLLIAKWDKENKVFNFNIQTSLFKFTVPAALGGKLGKIVLSSIGTVEVTGWSNTNVSTRNTNVWDNTYKTDVYMENAEGIPAGTYYFVVLPRLYQSGVRINTFDKSGEVYNANEYARSIDMRGTGADDAVKFGGKILDLGELAAEKVSTTTTVLASWKCDEQTHSQTVSPGWCTDSETGDAPGTEFTGEAYPEEKESGAVMKWSCVSGKSYALLIAAEGHYAVRYVGLGDAFVYTLPVPASGFKSGSVIRYQTAYGGGEKTSPKYWRIKYSIDNGANWEYAETGFDPVTLANNEISNLEPLSGVKAYKAVNASFKLTSDLAAGSTILIRHECADGDTGISGSVTKGNIRLTPFVDKDGKERSGPMITLEQ